MGMSPTPPPRAWQYPEIGPRRESYADAEKRLVAMAHARYLSEEPADAGCDTEWLEFRLAVILDPETGCVEGQRENYLYR